MPVIYAKRRREQALSSLLACAFDQLKLHRGATMLQYSMIFEKQQKSMVHPAGPSRNLPNSRDVAQIRPSAPRPLEPPRNSSFTA
jgi:hypothetical protein